MKHQAPVIPALAGIRFVGLEFFARRRPMFSFWIPAFAGMTEILPCCRTKQPDGMKALRLAVSDALVAELQAADVLVLGVPMYNFGIPVQLKAWVDGVSRVGVTFKYSETGPKGLLDARKKVYVGLARGGIYRDLPADTEVPYFKALFGFLGLTDLNFIYAEGLNMGPEAAQKGFAAAEAEIAALLP